MIDIHNHILYNVDDGPNTINKSIELLKLSKKNNITDIILTPHYIPNTKYNINNKKKQELLNKLKQSITENNIDINLYLGNEVYIDDKNVISYLAEDINTLNNSRYILVELQKNNKIQFLEDVLLTLKQNNLIPIIAHPERYNIYNRDYYFLMN